MRTSVKVRWRSLAGVGRVARPPARFAPGSAERAEVRAALTAGLADADTFLRWYALRGLHKLGEVEPVMAALADNDQELFRGEVLCTLAQLGDPATALRVVTRSLLNEPSHRVRERALHGILRASRADPAMRTLAIELGRRWLDDSDQRRVELGIQLLRYVGEPRAIDRAKEDRTQIRHLIALVAQADHPWPRRGAIGGLGTVGARTASGSPERAEVRAALVAALGDEVLNVRNRALRGLRGLGEEEPAVLALAGVDHEVFRGEVHYTLAHLGDPEAALRTVRRLIEAEPSHAVRMRAMVGIPDRCHLEPAARELAVQLGRVWLGSRSYVVLGLELLRFLQEPGEPGRCLRLLEHPDEYVRWHALVLLLRYPDLLPHSAG